ncbi:MAG: SemiSWEET family sugar transporter [Methylomonas sp.]
MRVYPILIAIVVTSGTVVASLALAEALPQRPGLLELSSNLDEVVGFVAGLGTTFAGLPDLIAMVKHRGTGGIRPRMNLITGLFQILWVWYGFLIVSRPVVLWNLLGVVINLSTVSLYFFFANSEKKSKR